MRANTRRHSFVVILPLLLVAGCTSSLGGAPAADSGMPATGGGAGPGTGGTVSSGGASGSGGAVASGGRTGAGSGGSITSGSGGSGGLGSGGATLSDAGVDSSPPMTGDGGAVLSAGCGMPAMDTPATFVRHTVVVGTLTREYYVRLPPMYNPSRAYPVIFVWHGAGGDGTRGNIPIQNSSGANAIVVGGTALVSATEMRTQWQTGGSSPDVAFFDALVSEVSAHYCVDRSRLFSAGFSSGAWFSNLLGCVRGDVMRAYGVVAGGTPGGGRTCTPGGVAAWFLHDENDTENVIAGNVTTRTRLLTANGCAMTTVPETPSPCVRYEGCRDGRPVVWCQTMGAGHSAQSSISGPGMWRFFSSF